MPVPWASDLQAIAGPAKCDVQVVVALNDTTVGVNPENTNASGVMLMSGGRTERIFEKLAKHEAGIASMGNRLIADVTYKKKAVLVRTLHQAFVSARSTGPEDNSKTRLLCRLTQEVSRINYPTNAYQASFR